MAKRGAKGKFTYWLTDDGLELLSGWARDGLTDELIADKMGIATSTLYEYKNKYSEIAEALKKNKEIADIKVESTLYKCATGYEYTEQVVSNGQVIDLKKFMPPNVTAIIFWLKNRKPSDWRDKQDVQLGGIRQVVINGEDDLKN